MLNSCSNRKRFKVIFSFSFRKTLLSLGRQDGVARRVVTYCLFNKVPQTHILNNINVLAYSSGSHRSKTGLTG